MFSMHRCLTNKKKKKKKLVRWPKEQEEKVKTMFAVQIASRTIINKEDCRHSVLKQFPHCKGNYRVLVGKVNNLIVKSVGRKPPQRSGFRHFWKTGKSGKYQGIFYHQGKQGNIREFCLLSGKIREFSQNFLTNLIFSKKPHFFPKILNFFKHFLIFSKKFHCFQTFLLVFNAIVTHGHFSFRLRNYY